MHRKRIIFSLSTVTLILFCVEGAIHISPLDDVLTRPTQQQEEARRLHKGYIEKTLIPASDGPGSGVAGVTFFRTAHRFTPARIAVPKPQGTVRIFMIGGSTVAGFIKGKDDAYMRRHAFAAKIKKLLGRRIAPRTLEVVNLGMHGGVSDYVLARVEEVTAYDPDLILIYTGLNDASVDLVRMTLEPDFAQKSWLRANLRLADLFVYLISNKAERSKTVLRDAQFLKNITAMTLAARKIGKPLFVCLPVTRDKNDFARQRRMIRAEAERGGAHPVNILPRLKQASALSGRPYKSYFSDFIHPNKRGYRVLAEAFVGALEKQGFLKQ